MANEPGTDREGQIAKNRENQSKMELHRVRIDESTLKNILK